MPYQRLALRTLILGFCGLLRSLCFYLLSDAVDGSEDFAFDVVEKLLRVRVAGPGGDGDPARVDALYGVSSVAGATAPAVGVGGLPLWLWRFAQSSATTRSYLTRRLDSYHLQTA